ncbi:MAG: nucleotidyltransferase family protein [Sphingopyxis sp.]|nr:nucleotidyltransferase family protein [Sphingopyxis sp.]
MSVGIHVLAAGQSMRFGAPKLDAPCAGRPLGAWILAAIEAAGLAPGTIIVPPLAPHFAIEAQRHGWTLAINEDAERGLSTSLACAIRDAERAGAEAACIFLADMPLITASHVRTIAEAGQPDRPVATLYPGGRLGVPARLPRALFAALTSGAADVGAAALLAAQPTLRAMTDDADLHDVDSPADMAQAEAVLIERLSYRGALADVDTIARVADG